MRARWPVVAGLILLGGVSPLWAGPFSEVPADHWAYPACTNLASLGLLPSDRATTFSGDPQLTRFEFGIVLLEPLSAIDVAVASVSAEADAESLLKAVAEAVRLSPRLSENEVARAFRDLHRLSSEFTDVLRPLSFDPARVSRALQTMADEEALRAWRVEALGQPAAATGLAGGSAARDTLHLPLAHGMVALSLSRPPEPPELLDYLAKSAAVQHRGELKGAGSAEPALSDPRVSRMRTAYEYGLGSALTLSLAYEEIARRGQGLAALDAASLASVGIGYQLTPSTSVKLSYSLLEYSNYLLDTPPLRDRLAETAVSIEF